MHTLSFTLKQHTPLIHFQHDQDGATLRATEVKPKLDKYIIKRMGGKEMMTRNWFNNYEKGSLDYKMSFSKSEIIWEDYVTIIPPNRDFAIKKDDFQVIFKSFHNALLSEIEKQIKIFFIQNNFGKRNSKGFGCFYIQGTNVNDFNIAEEQVYKYAGNDFINRGMDFYNKVSNKWRDLKSGSNMPYKKSRVFKYMFAQSMRWDKRWFKVELFDLINDVANTDPELKHDLLVTNNEPLDISEEENEGNQHGGYYSYDDNAEYDDNYFFGRAFLGLAEHYEFRTTRRDRIYKLKVKSTDVERFKSPVTFKVFDNNIFAIIELIPDGLKNANFIFDLIVKNPINNTVLKEVRNFTSLKTSSEFSLSDFAKSEFGSINFNKFPR